MADAGAASENRTDVFSALDSMSVDELTALIAAAEARRSDKMEEARRALVAEFRKKASSLGLSLESLVAAEPDSSRKSRARGTGRVAMKYRGPNGEEWSGRGRLPKWVVALEQEGRNREDFRIRD